MKDKILEQKKIIRIGCYKYHKFINTPDHEMASCPFGYIEIQPNCKHCIWFSVKKMAHGRRPLVTDREISEGDIEKIRVQYEQEEKLQKALPIRIEDKENGLHGLDSSI